MGLAVGLWSALRFARHGGGVGTVPQFPKIALVPLFIIWFGIGEGSKIITLAFGVFFPTVIATAGGVDNVPRSLIRMGQSFGLSTGAIVRKIVLPGALPAILSGFRVTASIAIVLLVAAEMIGAERGIGAFVLSAGNLYDTDALMAGIVVLSGAGAGGGVGDRSAGARAAGMAVTRLVLCAMMCCACRQGDADLAQLEGYSTTDPRHGGKPAMPVVRHASVPLPGRPWCSGALRSSLARP